MPPKRKPVTDDDCAAEKPKAAPKKAKPAKEPKKEVKKPSKPYRRPDFGQTIFAVQYAASNRSACRGVRCRLIEARA